jgi:general stress protein 26
MRSEPQRHDSLRKIAELVADMDVCMFTTMAGDGKLLSRPMAALEICSQGHFWFLTRESSAKTDQLEAVNLSFTDEANSIYVSVTGHGEVACDPRRLDELWTPQAKTWFPLGRDDPELTVLMVTMEMAEYWDAHSKRAIRTLAKLTSAVTGIPLSTGEHEVVHNPMAADPYQRSLIGY